MDTPLDRFLGIYAAKDGENEVREVVQPRKYRHLGNLEAAEVGAVLLWRPKCSITLRGVSLIPGAALTAHATNNRTFSVGTSATAAGAITAFDTIATTAGDTGNLVARTPVAMEIVPATDIVPAGHYLWMTYAIGGSGVVLAPHTWEIDWVYTT